MRVPSNLSRASPGFNMTPMIDVVFLLIIFFLVSSNLVQQEVHLEELDLPKARSGQRSEDGEVRRVVVNVLGEQRPGGRMMVGRRLLSEGELAELIRYESLASSRVLEVRIRSDSKVPYRVIEPVMIACAKAGVWKVTFAVVRN